MPGHRFFIKQLDPIIKDRAVNIQSIIGTEILLDPSDSHHAKDVLRLAPKSEIEIILPEIKARFRATIEFPNGCATAKLVEYVAPSAKINPVQAVAFASCKNDNNSFVIEKCCELGVEHIYLWLADRSIARWDKDPEAKLSRYRKIAEAGAKQCGRSNIPTVTLSNSLQEVIETSQRDSDAKWQLIYGALQNDALNAQELPLLPSGACLIIGPEGDLSEREISLLRSFKALPLSLGDLVLRSETAAIVGIVTINVAQG